MLCGENVKNLNVEIQKTEILKSFSVFLLMGIFFFGFGLDRFADWK
jgi:hypothetical protein